jgi:hypothetical protein
MREEHQRYESSKYSSPVLLCPMIPRLSNYDDGDAKEGLCRVDQQLHHILIHNIDVCEWCNGLTLFISWTIKELSWM